MTNENTDNTDEPSKAELHDRVQQLESTVAKMMPSRRDALKLGAAGIAGAAGLSATSQSAEASTGSAGDIGAPNNRPDVFADTVDANSLSGSVKNQGCRVFLSSDQSINTDITKIQFDSKVYDSDNNFDTSSHSWTCPQNGLYAVNLQVKFVGGGGDQNRELFIGDQNPFSANEGASNRQNSSDSGDRLSVSTINKYTSGDTIAGHAINSNTAGTLSSSSDSSGSFLEVAFLGGL